MRHFLPWYLFTAVMQHFVPWYLFTAVMWHSLPSHYFTAVMEHFLPWYHFTTVMKHFLPWHLFLPWCDILYLDIILLPWWNIFYLDITWCSKCPHWGTCSYKNTSLSRPAKEAKERRGSIESVDDLWSGRGRSMEKHPALSFLLERSIHELNAKIFWWLYWRGWYHKWEKSLRVAWGLGSWVGGILPGKRKGSCCLG